MKIFRKGSFEIITADDVLKNSLLDMEKAGRTCYRSEKNLITLETAKKFVKMILNRKHFAVIEHGSFMVKFSHISRGFTHELVRHRLMAICQESTRYVDYVKKFNEVDLNNFQAGFILPPHKDINEKLLLEDGRKLSVSDMFSEIEIFYRTLRKNNWLPEDARQILPIGIESSIVISTNFREWRHILRMRTAKSAHWEIRSVMNGLLCELQKKVPVLFDDFIKIGEDKNNLAYYECQNQD